MKRKVIEIDDSKCNGCGVCIPNCPEGALQIIDGKARLVSDLFCDGLGACIGECPRGAIHVVEREAEPYDERLVMANIVKQGVNTIAAHLQHLHLHGESKLHQIALAFLAERGIAVPEQVAVPHLACGCPGTLAKKLEPQAKVRLSGGGSALRQWPVQLKLLNPGAEYFDNADLLISADCVAHAYGSFHRDFLDGRILVVFCPKLDNDTDEYIEKLAEIFRQHKIRSITILRMVVPCCGGTVAIVEKALALSGKQSKIEVKVIALDGSVQ